jgi:hypothetical protein
VVSGSSDAAYDEIADWYEKEFLGRESRIRDGNPLDLDRVLGDLLGVGARV